MCIQLRRGLAPMPRLAKKEVELDVARRFYEMVVDPFLAFGDADVIRMPTQLLEFLVERCGVGESLRPPTVAEDLWDALSSLEIWLSQTIFNELISRKFEAAVRAQDD